MRHNNKDDYLIKKVIPFDVNKIRTIEDLLENLKYCGFQGGNLGKALDILERMVSDNECLKVLALSGAMVPAGMGGLISSLIEHNIIDVLITTGANITHDLIDTIVNIGHYLGNPNVDDNELYNLEINRIYDIFLPEDNYKITRNKLLEIIDQICKDKKLEISPSEFLKLIGNKIDKKCILSLAAKHKIPIFIPAFSDSELALDLIKFTVKEGYEFNFNIFEDVKKFAEIIKTRKKAGLFIVGGGVPRNWAQQIFPYLDHLEQLREHGIESGYKYSVRIHTATEYDGGLSGCTTSESKSWGKYALDSQYVSVWCDATIALPILVTGLFQRLKII